MKVPYTDKLTEADVQFKLGLELNSKFPSLEIRFEVNDFIKLPNRSQRCRFDIVVYSNGEALCIIEVKKPGKTVNRNRQMNKYERYDCGLVYCIGIEGIPSVIDFVDNLLQAPN